MILSNWKLFITGKKSLLIPITSPTGRTTFLLLSILSSLFFPHSAGCEEPTSYFNVKYLGNHDGDSIIFDIPGMPPIVGERMVIRLREVDTPELNKAQCEQERKNALKAKNRVHSLLKSAKVINLHRAARGKYFRILADIEFDNQDLATVLLDEELAIPYSGGARNHSWCNEPQKQKQTKRSPVMIPPVINGVYVWPPPPQQEPQTNAGEH